MAKEVTKKETAGLPAEMMQSLVSDAGMGAENATSDDMVVPFIRVAQSLSDQINKRDSSYIEGLEEGDFFNSATEKSWKGDDGFYFIPVHYQRKYIEWKTRAAGGGFVAERDESAMQFTTRDDNGRDMLDNGNELVLHATWFILVVDPDTGGCEQAVIDLSKTQHKKSRQLVTKLKTISLPNPNGGRFNPPTFYNLVKARSVPESNDLGRWMGWDFDIAGNVLENCKDGKDLYDQAKMMMESVKKGAIRAADIAEDVVEDEGVLDEENVPF